MLSHVGNKFAMPKSMGKPEINPRHHLGYRLWVIVLPASSTDEAQTAYYFTYTYFESSLCLNLLYLFTGI